MLIHDMKRPSFMKRKSNRRWRWNATWRGNYSWRWLKWQKARSGFSLHAWFEWWQTPLFQRLPKNRGFKKYFKHISNFITINLQKFQDNANVSSGDTINYDFLVSNWYIRVWERVKILWNWDLNKKLIFAWFDLFSKTAKQKILDAGWEIVDIDN